jgi:hypothetical protein
MLTIGVMETAAKLTSGQIAPANRPATTNSESD